MIMTHFYIVSLNLYDKNHEFVGGGDNFTYTIMDAYKTALNMVMESNLDLHKIIAEVQVREVFLSKETLKDYDDFQDYIDNSDWQDIKPFYKKETTILQN